VTSDRLDDLFPAHLKVVMQRTDGALEAAGFDALVIHAGAPITLFLDDHDHPFKTNPHFKAWVPLPAHPHCAVIYRPGAKPTLLFYRPDDYWHKPPDLPTGAWTREVEVITIATPDAAAGHWSNLGHTALIGPPAAFGSADPAELLTRLHYDRAVKTEYELECMRRASELGARGHRAALAAFRSGESEYQVHMRYLEACVQREEEMPYNNIVAYNENAAVLHYQHLARTAPTALRSFLIDAGAQYRGYASDITRTYAATPGRFADLIERMDEAQLAMCALIRSGTDYRDVHLSAHRIIGDVLQAAGVLNVGGQTALESGATSVFFPHGIGHLLGLQVHDVGGVMADAAGHERVRPKGHPYLRLTRMLEPGVVVTMEPGVYWIDSLLKAASADARRDLIDWSVVEELRPYGGIRIEDDVVATAATPENLTRNAFVRIGA
jgi:Xaa-Pro dipeptidase